MWGVFQKGTRGPLFPVLNITESYDFNTFAAAALQLDSAGHDLREQVAALTAALRVGVAGLRPVTAISVCLPAHRSLVKKETCADEGCCHPAEDDHWYDQPPPNLNNVLMILRTSTNIL